MPRSKPASSGQYIQDLMAKDAERYAAFWTKVDGVAQMEGGWQTEEDAYFYLECLVRHGRMDPEGEIDVRAYAGECPW